MKTTVNNNNIESKNGVINYDIEIVRDFDGTYYVNARNELHEHIKGLPEYLPYKELKKAVKEALGVTLPPLKSLTFEGNGRKQYANAYGLQGIEIHQEPLAFGLQDKVILGSFGESRPYAIGCTVTAYKWSTKIGEFMYRLQGEDGKEYWDVARNIIHDPKGDEKPTFFDEQSGKAEREPASEITEFFTKGKKYRCIKSVIGNKSGRETFTKGQIYEQYTEPSAFYGWLRNNQGERHAWPQIDEIADYLETWPEAKPEDIDPRLYFEPVEDGKAEKAAKVKETYKTGLLVTDTKFGHDYERITGIEEGMNTYIVTTATKIQVECMKHHRVMEKAKNEHTVADLPEWVRPGAVLMINGTWKWEEVEIVELADGCVWYKKGNSVMGWTYDHFISLYVNLHYAKVKEYAPEPTLEDIGKFRAVCEAEGCTYPGDVEGTSEYYRDALLTAAEGQTVSYQFGNCRFDCKRNESGTWDVHAYDTDGEDTTFEGRTASFFGGMFNDLFKTWGSGNLPEPPAEVHIDAA